MLSASSSLETTEAYNPPPPPSPFKRIIKLLLFTIACCFAAFRCGLHLNLTAAYRKRNQGVKGLALDKRSKMLQISFHDCLLLKPLMACDVYKCNR